MARIEQLDPFGGDRRDSTDGIGHGRDIARGRSLLQLEAVRQTLDQPPPIREAWSPGTFSDVIAPDGTRFDALTGTIAYHFRKHFGGSDNEDGKPVNQGKAIRDVLSMTMAAVESSRSHGHLARKQQDGLLNFPDGSVDEPSGKILTDTGD